MTATAPAIEPDIILDWTEVVDSDTTLPYWIHRAGHAEWQNARIRQHSHRGFAEMFWVEQGGAVHEINGGEHPIRAGDLVFVDTDDIHRFRSSTSDFSIVNLAVPSEVVNDVVTRDLGASGGPWQRPPPRVVRLAVHDWARLVELGSGLGHGRPSLLRVDHFLIEVLLMLDGPVPATQPMPMWLARAIQAWRDDPAAMLAGVSGIARISSRAANTSAERSSRPPEPGRRCRQLPAHRARRVTAAHVRSLDHPRRR